MNEGRYAKVGLTGGIGTGKSTVSKRLTALGANVLDADQIARNLLARDGECYLETVRLFGGGILREDGSIDRHAVADIVFSDAGKRGALNRILHPAVLERMMEACRSILLDTPGALVIFDVPLLLECGWEQYLDAVILVTARKENVIKRVMKRDQASMEQIQDRILAQMPQEEKIMRADFILENDGDLETLTRRVDILYQQLTGGIH